MPECTFAILQGKSNAQNPFIFPSFFDTLFLLEIIIILISDLVWRKFKLCVFVCIFNIYKKSTSPKNVIYDTLALDDKMPQHNNIMMVFW